MNLDDDDDFETVDELPAPPRQDIPADDLELLKLAARALGAVQVEVVDGENWVNLHFADGTIVHGWNPLQFSGDALELAVKLMINIQRYFPDSGLIDAHAIGCKHGCFEELEPDPYAATRRAIVRAAAEIIHSME